MFYVRSYQVESAPVTHLLPFLDTLLSALFALSRPSSFFQGCMQRSCTSSTKIVQNKHFLCCLLVCWSRQAIPRSGDLATAYQPCKFFLIDYCSTLAHCPDSVQLNILAYTHLLMLPASLSMSKGKHARSGGLSDNARQCLCAPAHQF